MDRQACYRLFAGSSVLTPMDIELYDGMSPKSLPPRHVSPAIQAEIDKAMSELIVQGCQRDLKLQVPLHEVEFRENPSALHSACEHSSRGTDMVSYTGLVRDNNRIRGQSLYPAASPLLQGYYKSINARVRGPH